MSDQNQHNIEIQLNLQKWREKPLLRRVYQQFYKLILAEIDLKAQGSIVELGSGIGNLKSVLPEALCTDLFANPWIDRVENAYMLGFSNESLSHLILFDVFHHLEYPGDAFREFLRVLKPGGRVIIFEPDISLLGWLVYGLLHHEPVSRFKPIKRFAPVGTDHSKLGYYAAQGNAGRVFLNREWHQTLCDWELRTIKRFSALSYLASGGYSKKQMLPAVSFPVLRAVECILDCFPALFSTRLLVVMEKGTRNSRQTHKQSHRFTV